MKEEEIKKYLKDNKKDGNFMRIFEMNDPKILLVSGVIGSLLSGMS